MPRFVLLEHRWNGVHWDFMLEAGRVLRTWAIDAPIVAGQDLPARALRDHRPVYLDYEGEVSGEPGTRATGRRGDLSASLSGRPTTCGSSSTGLNSSARSSCRSVGLESGGRRPWIFRLGNLD